MLETPESGTNFQGKCSDTTAANTPNTLGEQARPKKRSGGRTPSKRRASATNVSSVKREPLPRYLPSELHRLTFTAGENRYQADDTEHTFAWKQFIADYANVTGDVDWEDLEERAHFLNMLYEFCEAQGIPFPLEDSRSENINEKLNAR